MRERGDCVDDVMWCLGLESRKLYATGGFGPAASQLPLSSWVKLKALIPFQAPYLRFDCIYSTSAPALSHSWLHPCLCAASFGGEVQYPHLFAKYPAHCINNLSPHRCSPYPPSRYGAQRDQICLGPPQD